MTPSIAVVLPAIAADRDLLEERLNALWASAAREIVAAVPEDERAAFDALRARQAAATWVSGPRGRGAQMNAGASATASDWLLFLHVDCRLAEGWERAIAAAARDPRVVAGSYRFALDSASRRARVIEFGARLRVRLLGLPYGDQAIFVRRDAFLAIDGYREWPLMEDVDLVRRLGRRGRLHHADIPVVTSARRWERDGWTRRSLRNAWLVALFFCGASPAWLASRYAPPARRGARLDTAPP